MAVKKHELVHDNRTQLDLPTLVQYLQLINDQPHCMYQPNEVVRICQDIVKCLGKYELNVI